MEDNFFSELYSRIKEPRSGSFYWYLVLFVFIIGGAGIWIPIVKDCQGGLKSLPDNLITFGIAIIGPALYSLSLSFFEFKNKPSLNLFTYSILIIDIILLLTLYNCNPLIPGIVFVLEAIFLWKITNNDNKKLDDEEFGKDVEDKVSMISKSLGK